MTLTNYCQLIFLFSLGIGYGMFQANIIQFGIDQLTDASTTEIVSFDTGTGLMQAVQS